MAYLKGERARNNPRAGPDHRLKPIQTSEKGAAGALIAHLNHTAIHDAFKPPLKISGQYEHIQYNN
eukprot:scaffold63565_cov24-Prasinocladus_malaysianus.AAC.1